MTEGDWTPDRAALEAALRSVADPVSGQDLVAAGLVDGIETRGSLVQASLRASRDRLPQMERARQEAERALARVPGVTNASVVLTSHRAAGEAGQQAAPPGRPARGASAAGAPGAHAQPRPQLLSDVRHVVAVASGKGGVGKSTTAVNLAVSLARRGLRVGLLDADVYGPSLPQMLGTAAQPDVRNGRVIPLEAWGLRAMSIGFLVDADRAMAWRGPMVMSALEQMMGQAEWGPLDIMVVDMPPGTGDAPITLAQRVAMRGAVVVSTPQDVALADVRRGVRLFEQVRVPILGLVENMAHYCCPNCGHRTELFGHGGVRKEAERLGAPFLGEVPLLLEIRATADAGTPIAAAQPDSPAAQAYQAIAGKVWAAVERAPAAGPRITVE